MSYARQGMRSLKKRVDRGDIVVVNLMDLSARKAKKIERAT